jgi:hypothetical protein
MLVAGLPAGRTRARSLPDARTVLPQADNRRGDVLRRLPR